MSEYPQTKVNQTPVFELGPVYHTMAPAKLQGTMLKMAKAMKLKGRALRKRLTLKKKKTVVM